MIKPLFKFLDSFTLADRNIFFGRDQEITNLADLESKWITNPDFEKVRELLNRK